jgi:hypothetical protein
MPATGRGHLVDDLEFHRLIYAVGAAGELFERDELVDLTMTSGKFKRRSSAERYVDHLLKRRVAAGEYVKGRNVRDLHADDESEVSAKAWRDAPSGQVAVDKRRGVYFPEEDIRRTGRERRRVGKRPQPNT